MSVAFPLRVGPNNRYLVDANGAPFWIKGDAGSNWDQLFVTAGGSTTPGPTLTELNTYLTNRQAKGFNANFLSPIVRLTNLGGMVPDPDNNPVFTTAGDVSTPSAAFFSRLTTVVQNHASVGIAVFLFVAWAGFPSSVADWYANGLNTQQRKMRDYGRYLGNWGKSLDNIVWCLWGDHDATNLELYNQLAQGIVETDTTKPKIFSAEMQRGNASSDGLGAYTTWLGADWAYAPFDQTYYQQIRTKRGNARRLPVFMGEGWYEGEHSMTAQQLRTQLYWALCQGACGYIFGNNPVWDFDTGWPTALNAQGSQDCSRGWTFIDSIPWYKCDPDDSHVVVTSGFGTDGTTSYSPALYARDRTLLVLYTPTTNSPVVDMTKMRGASVTAQWFDPTNSSYTTISGSPFANTGSRTFTHPGTNSNGGTDWVLRLDA